MSISNYFIRLPLYKYVLLNYYLSTIDSPDLIVSVKRVTDEIYEVESKLSKQQFEIHLNNSQQMLKQYISSLKIT